MVRVLEFPAVSFENIFKHIDVSFYHFNLEKCDERTFYLSIAISANTQPIICDLIFLVDKQSLYGAISLNDKYDKVRSFFKQRFQYDLLYSDEQTIAQFVRQSSHFQQYFKQFAKLYPTYVQPSFLR